MNFAGFTGLLGHTANWPILNAYISYFGDRTRPRATEVGYISQRKGSIWLDLNPKSLDSRGVRREGLTSADFAGSTGLVGHEFSQIIVTLNAD